MAGHPSWQFTSLSCLPFGWTCRLGKSPGCKSPACQFESHFDNFAIVILNSADHFYQDRWRFWYRCFPVNFVNFLRAPFFIEHLSGGCFWRFYYIAMEWHNGMEQLDSHIFNIITQLGNNKKQPNDNSIYNCILKTEEWLTTDQLKDRLCDLLKPINSKINCIVEKTHILL